MTPPTSSSLSTVTVPTKPERGALVVIEGADRVGKTTLSGKLVESLIATGVRVKSMKFPDRSTHTGKLIDRYLKGEVILDDHTAHLLFSANRWEVFHPMKSLLEEGTTLVVDRYAYSGVAYSAAKEGMDFDWCKASDAGLIKADVVLYLSLSEKETLARPGYGDEIYEKADFQAKVKDNYEQLKDESWASIDGALPVPQLEQVMLDNVVKVIERCRQQSLSFLW